MTPLRRLAAGAAVAAMLASGTACTKDDPVAAPTIAPPATVSATSSPSVTVTPTVTPTPKPTLSQRAQAQADAIAMVKEYYALSDKLAGKPPGLEEAKRKLSAVAISDELAYSISYIGELHNGQQHQTGSVAVLGPQVELVDLSSKPNATPPRMPVVKVRICTDVSDLDLLDSKGKSLSNPKRQMRRLTHLEVVNSNWPSRSGWRVRDIRDETTSC